MSLGWPFSVSPTTAATCSSTWPASPPPVGQDRTIQANHPEAVSYAFAHPTWFTVEEVDRAFLRGMGYKIGTVASSVIRNGSGVNPLGYTQTTPAEIGSTWTTAVDIVTPGHPISVVAISSLPGTSGIFPGGSIVGEFLVQPAGFLQLDFANGTHNIPLPNNPSLIGQCIATQGATISALGQAHLNNALDIVIGG